MQETMRDAERFLRQRKVTLTTYLREVVVEDAANAAEEPRERAEAQTLSDIRGRLSERERRELAEIDAALNRIAEGTYGHCETCGKAIGRHRLRAVPEARHCLTCGTNATARPSP